MDQRCTPRIECLEPRQVLNSSLAPGPVVPLLPAVVAVVQVPSPPDLTPARAPAGDGSATSLDANQGLGAPPSPLPVVTGPTPGPAAAAAVLPPTGSPSALLAPVGTAEDPGSLKPVPAAAAGLDLSSRHGEESGTPPVVDQGTTRPEEPRPQGKSDTAHSLRLPAWALRLLVSTEKGAGTGRSETRPQPPPAPPPGAAGPAVSGNALLHPGAEDFRPLVVGRAGPDQGPEPGGGNVEAPAPPSGEGFARATGLGAEDPPAPSTPAAWAGLLTTLWARRLKRGTPSPPSGGGTAGPAGPDGDSLPPLYLGTLPVILGQPHDPVDAGYRFLCNYARHAIRAAERRVGPLTDHEDIVQQICVEWLEQAGPPAVAFPRLLEQAPVEMDLLRATVSRVIARVAYQQRRGRSTNVFTDAPAPERAAEREWAEFKSDCEQGVGNLSGPEWQILELRRQGQTFAEIGAAVGLPKQRVWELYQEVVARLQGIYREAGGGSC